MQEHTQVIRTLEQTRSEQYELQELVESEALSLRNYERYTETLEEKLNKVILRSDSHLGSQA
eukprot:2544113-Amphidinium_carterae.3